MQMGNSSAIHEQEAIRLLSDRIFTISKTPVKLMEVCGGHTMAIHKFGLKGLLPKTIQLLSGPGCPVCVTSQHYLDECIYLSRIPDVIIATYGDLIRVPASETTLEQERSKGADIRIVYSVMEALAIAQKYPAKKIVFLGIGFETTAPSSAYSVRYARDHGIQNFFLLSAHKVMPPALEALASEGNRIDGLIAPGHVTAITGTTMYHPLVENYGIGVVISGFRQVDIMQSIVKLVIQFETNTPKVENQYKRAVRESGNRKAQELMNTVFEPADDQWRGIGMIPQSGLKLRKEFSDYDSNRQFKIPSIRSQEPKGCICGEILKGLKTPSDCSLFGDPCSPEHPVGACMVSGEGSCAIHYKYNPDQ